MILKGTIKFLQAAVIQCYIKLQTAMLVHRTKRHLPNALTLVFKEYNKYNTNTYMYK